MLLARAKTAEVDQHTPSHVLRSSHLKRYRYFVAILLYVLAVLPRLHHIGHDTIQPDEYHWLGRSHEALLRLGSENWRFYSDHLGHPGIPAVLLMATAEHLTNRYYGTSDDLQVNHLAFARRAIALASTAAIPILFLFAAPFVGYGAAFVAACLLALSPSHLALSRMAHIDAVLTVFTLLTVLLYARGVQERKKRFVLLAGLTWGVSVATKPIAGFLLPAFLALRIVHHRPRREPIFHWVDVWAVIIGHITFALLYTRLWHPNNRYVYKFHIDNFFTSSLEHPSVLLAASALLCAIVGFVQRRRFIGQASFVLAFLLGANWLFPIVCANVVRYWTWAMGLSNTVHSAYGLNWNPPAHGYFGLFLSRVPLVVLGGLALGCAALLWMRREAFRSREGLFIWFCIAVLLCWAGLLSTSQKQTFRYLLPMMPLVCLIAAWGYDRLYHGWNSRGRNMFVGTLLGVQLLGAVWWWPDWHYFQNLFAPGVGAGLRKDVALGRPLPVTGIDRMLNHLQDAAAVGKRDMHVAVLGDIDILNFAYRRQFRNPPHRLRFIAYENLTSADFVLVFPGFIARMGQLLGPVAEQLRRVSSVSVRGADILELYEAPYPDYAKPVEFQIQTMARTIGRIGPLPGSSTRGVLVDRGTDPAGYLCFGHTVRLPRGEYVLRLPLATNDTGVPADARGVRIELGRRQLRVAASEISRHELRDVLFPINYDRDVAPQLRIYWFGEVGVLAGNPVVERRSGRENGMVPGIR